MEKTPSLCATRLCSQHRRAAGVVTGNALAWSRLSVSGDFSCSLALGTWIYCSESILLAKLSHRLSGLLSQRPEIRQYFIQSDTEGSRSRGATFIIYQRAKNVLDERPFKPRLGAFTGALNG